MKHPILISILILTFILCGCSTVKQIVEDEASTSGIQANYNLTLKISGTGAVSPDLEGTNSYTTGTTITLTAVETSGAWEFSNWEINSETTMNAAVNILMLGDKKVTLNFIEK